MTRHTHYPPFIPTYRRRRHPALRALLGAVVGAAVLTAIVMGTVAAIAKLERMTGDSDAAFLRGMAAGAQTCGSRP